MSKHRSRSRDNNEQNNNFMGLNPQMLQMLGLSSADIQRISGLMNSMNSDGFDINSLGNLLNPNNNMNNNMNNDVNNNFNNNLNNQSNNSNNQNNLDNNQNSTNNMNNNMDFSYLLNMLNNMGNNPNYTNGMMNNNSNNYNAENNFSDRNNFNNRDDFSDNSYNNYPKEEYEYEDGVDVEIIEPDFDTDPNLSMLKAVKSLVNDDRKKFLKRVIEMYKNGEIIY